MARKAFLIAVMVGAVVAATASLIAASCPARAHATFCLPAEQVADFIEADGLVEVWHGTVKEGITFFIVAKPDGGHWRQYFQPEPDSPYLCLFAVGSQWRYPKVPPRRPTPADPRSNL